MSESTGTAAAETTGPNGQASVEEIKEKAGASLSAGIGGIKIKVGQPDWQTDLARVAAMREHLGDAPLMVDANQQAIEHQQELSASAAQAGARSDS